MQTEQFIEKLKDALEVNSDISENTELNSIEEYDSIAVLSIIALIDENFGKTIKAADFKSLTTVKSLMDLIGGENFEK